MALSENSAITIPEWDKWFQAALGGSDKFDYANLEKAISFCPRRKLAIDVGAHIGTWTRPLSEKFEQVIAYEPYPENYECLRKNVSAKNVDLRLMGLSNCCQQLPMMRGIENSGQNHVDRRGDQLVTLEPLDSENLVDVDFLKIDVEGYELFALCGALETIIESRPIILIEENFLCERYGVRHMAASQFLYAIGYEVLDVANKDIILGPRH